MRGDWRVVKVNPFRGQYPRLLRLDSDNISTLDASTHRCTNSFPLEQVLSCVAVGHEVLLEVAPQCGIFCGLIKHQLRFLLDSPAMASAIGAAVRSRLVRHLTAEDSERARLLAADSAVLSAAPSDDFRASNSLSSGSNADAAPAPGTGADEAPTRYYTFDVAISIHKARNLPSPPALAGGPLVAIRWGAPAPPHVSLMSTAASSTSVAGASSRRGSSVVGLSAQHPLTESSPLGDAAAGADEDAEDGLYAPVRCTTAPGDGDACNPRWSHEACFRYRASDSELRSRRLVLNLYHRSWPFGSKEIGTCFVTLMDIATGPHRFDLPVLAPSGGGHAGRIVFQVQMVQQCRLSVFVPSVTCTMRALARHTSLASQEAAHQMASYALSASLTMAEAESPPTRCDFDSKALKLTEKAQVLMSLPESEKAAAEPRIAIIAHASAGAFDKESLHLCVWESMSGAALQQHSGRMTPPSGSAARSFGVSKQRLLGEVWLPVTKVHAPTEKRTYDGKFSEVLWLHGQRIGRLEGVVRISNGPKFMQLPAGFYTEAGIVPVGPIAAGGAGTQTMQPSPSAPGTANTGDSVTSNSLQDFEQTPKGLVLPKEVEQVVSLVTSLRNVLLELHLDAHAEGHADASNDGDDGRLSDLLRPHDAPGSRFSGGGQLIGRSLSSDRLGNDESLRQKRLSNDGGVDGRGMGRRSSSADRMNETSAGTPVKSVGRLGNAEMAARRLMFLLRRLQLLLDLSSKESCKAFFYSSVGSLQWTQRLLIRLWAFLLSQLDSVAFRFQPAIFETLQILMHRGELDCSAMMEAPTSLLERYRKVLWETTAYVISKLSHKAAPTEVRSFCSQALATAFFRLPALRIELLKIILPPGESRHKHVREWNLPWSLQKSALREAYDDSSETVVALGKRSSWFTRSSLQACFTRAAASAASVVSDKLSGANASSTTIAVPEDGASGSDKSKSPHVSPRASARASPRAARRASSGGISGAAGSDASITSSIATAQARAASAISTRGASAASMDTEPLSGRPSLPMETDILHLDQWSQLWRTRLDSASVVSERMLAGRYWRERLRKRGHCFFLFFEHWLQHTTMAMGTQPGEAVIWKDVPGAPTLMKAFLIEMKQRPIHLWPESMVSCMVMLIKENRQVLQVCVRILLARVGTALHLRTSLAVLAHLDAVLRAIAPEPLPLNFSAEPLLHMLHHLAESEHFKLAASALIFLYNHLDALGDTARLSSLSWLHSRFAIFALHWSRVVRTIFFHLAVIKVINWTPSPASSPAAAMIRRSSKDLEALNAGHANGTNGEVEKLLRRSISSDEPRVGSGSFGRSGGGRLASTSMDSGASNGASDHRSASNGSSASLDMSTMRDVENLLEFHRLRDLFSESVASLGKAAAALQSLQGTKKPPANRGGGAAGGRGRGRGGVRPGGRGGGRNGGWRPMASRSSRAMQGDRPDGDLTPEAAATVAAAAQAAIAQAALELGLGDPNSPSVRRVLEYSTYALTEYHQVVKKWNAAQEMLATRVDDGAPALSKSAGAIGRSASSGMLSSDNTPIRRSLSEPSLPVAPNPLALSLSMIASHVHDDEDEVGAEHEEW